MAVSDTSRCRRICQAVTWVVPTWTKPWSLLSALVTLLLLAGGCAGTPEVDPKAAAIWHKNEAIFRQALNGHQENDDFDHACAFFEQVTGMSLHLDFFTFGILPTPESEHDLMRLRAWYRRNKHRLYWDEQAQAVKVRPE